MSQKEKVSEVLVVAGLLAFAYWRYSRLSSEEKDKLHDDVKQIGTNMLKEFVPSQVKPFVPTHWK